jgi:hypothetical protein
LTVDFVRTIFRNVPPSRGRCHETSLQRGGMRRPRAGLVTPLPGGLGSPSAPTMRGCLRWLDAARTKAGESWPDRLEPKAARVRARTHGPGGQTSRRGAPRGARASQGALHERISAASYGAPPPLFRGTETTGDPGASTKNSGGGALAFLRLILRSARRARLEG